MSFLNYSVLTLTGKLRFYGWLSHWGNEMMSQRGHFELWTRYAKYSLHMVCWQCHHRHRSFRPVVESGHLNQNKNIKYLRPSAARAVRAGDPIAKRDSNRTKQTDHGTISLCQGREVYIKKWPISFIPPRDSRSGARPKILLTGHLYYVPKQHVLVKECYIWHKIRRGSGLVPIRPLVDGLAVRP